MSTEERDAVEAFIEETVGRAAPSRAEEADAARERAEAAREDAEFARQELFAAIDLERLDALAADRADARRVRAQNRRRRAVDASEEVARRLAELTPVLPIPPESMNVILDRVTFIRSFADAGVVIDSNIGSLDSWARYRLSASADAITETGLGRLSFFVLWHNPRTEAVVVNVGPRVVVNAHLSVDADWNGVASWFIAGSEARATVRARTTVWAMWDATVHAIVHDRILASAGATGGFFGGDDSASIAFNEFLPGAGFTVPAQASILIEVEILTEHVTTSGSIELDAESGAFRVEVPHLILTLT
ncbi:hypothetical protein J7E25_02500 [Agromyces sp. ISL-38]|uniref:hypothetical protein n=1 Tax=Agromyces sp. ISL-38 TaxID=2819107 RepID=UPI001BEBBDC6|nr:hypothetical protein [Agromyces sp. ISL-38]MBT2497957.1 hypothetical protein [Agromyces sp. ISL-38]